MNINGHREIMEIQNIKRSMLEVSYDLLKEFNLVEKASLPGNYLIIWNFSDNTRAILPPDFYIYRIIIDDEAESRIVLLEK